jgi:hypothetical protein
LVAHFVTLHVPASHFVAAELVILVLQFLVEELVVVPHAVEELATQPV